LRDACRQAGIGFAWYREYAHPTPRLMEIDEQWYAERRRQARRSFSASRRLYWSLIKRPYTRIASRR